MERINAIFEKWRRQRELGIIPPDHAARPPRDIPSILRAAEVPRDLRDAFCKLDMTQPVVFAKKFIDSRTPLLLLLGRKGTGKTMAAVYALALIAQEYEAMDRPSGDETRSGTTALFVRGVTFARYLADNNFLERLLRVGCLVLDDLGKEFPNAMIQSRLFELLDTRIGSRRRTAITSNFSKREFANRYGAILADRLGGNTMCEVFEGESLRGRAAIAPAPRQCDEFETATPHSAMSQRNTP